MTRPPTSAANTVALRRVFTVATLLCIGVGVTSFAMNLAPGLLGSNALRAVALGCAAVGLPCVLAAMFLDQKIRHQDDNSG